jgi:hypothetical protein
MVGRTARQPGEGPQPVSEMHRADLIAELHSYEVDINPRWVAIELGYLLREQRLARGIGRQKDPMSGMPEKPLAELVKICEEKTLRVPPKPTKGLLLLMLREHFEEQSMEEEVMTIGKDLRQQVQWKMRTLFNKDDEDFNGGKPSRTTKTSTASNAGPSTSRSVTANRGMPPAWPLAGPISRRKADLMEATPATPAPMESSIPPEESARIQELEAQLAVLRDKHKLPPSSAASSATG